ncbi:MAG: response regulator, partial [Halioglobus sp.]|nr:response regulator [Halioglobus sp.]
ADPGAVEADLDTGWDLDDNLEDLLGESPEAAAGLAGFTPEAESGAPEARLDTGWDLDDFQEDSPEEARDDAPQVQEPARDEVREEAPAAAQAAPLDADSPEAGGFGEDIFGDSFADDFEGEWTLADGDLSSDIDAAFSALSAADSEPAADEICGVDVEEFGSKESVEPILEQAVDDIGSSQAGAAQAVGSAAAANDASDLAWCIPPHIKFSYTTQSGAEIFADFLDAFIEEGSSEVEKLEDLISEWEQDINAEAVYAQVSRTLHTLKGIGKGVGLQRFGTLIHNFETLLEALPRPDVDDAASYFRVVNVWLDAVVRGIDFVGKQRRDIDSELPQPGRKDALEPVAVEPAAQVQAAPVAEEGRDDNVEPDTFPEVTPPATPPQSAAAAERERKRDQQLADEGAKALAAQQSVRITPEKLDHLLNLASQTQQLCVRASQATTRGKRSTSELQGRLSSVRTHIAKIADRALLSVNARGMSSTPDMDALEMDQYSELQEAASILREGVEDLADLIDVLSRQNSQVETLLKQQSSVISSISSSIQAARVVPVSRLMPGLRRIVRTVSTDLGKVVTFKVLNEIGALDRDHYARLQVVLEHMVRNALDHGIESPEERLSAGKSNAGRITIDVRKSGGDYIVRLSDDGRGIDPDAIRESAYNKGLDVDVDALSDDEAIRLIFHKGFSTASKLSEISGRGVGMDIVLSELQQIGGDVQIQSAVGLGTSFEVRIPSNVTVNGALLVTAADHSYAIPLNGLIAVEQVPVNEFFDAMDSGASLKLFDMACTPAYLATLCQGVGLPERNFWEGFVPVIVAGSENRRMAIAIDNVQEALELVVRSLGSQFAAVPGLAGAATTADGEAIVALDLNLLVDSVGEEGLAQVAVHHDKDKTLLALVVDDSRTQRMVATSQLDTVGVETITAENGLVAIDLLNATHRLPDVVLLDVEMPVKDGIETLREIRKSQRYGHLPVIMVTSRTGAKHRAMAKEAGCNAYMGKPFNFPALIEQINVLTGYDLQLS